MRCLHFTDHPDGQLQHIRILQIRQIPLNILYGLAPAFPCKYGILKSAQRLIDEKLVDLNVKESIYLEI